MADPRRIARRKRSPTRMFRDNVELDPSRVRDMRGVPAPDWLMYETQPWVNARGGANHETSEKRALERLRLRREKRGRRMSKAPEIKGGAPVPAGAVGAAVSAGRAVLGRLKGSPITGPTKVARISSAAATPVAGSLGKGRKPKPPTRTRPPREPITTRTVEGLDGKPKTQRYRGNRLLKPARSRPKAF